MSIQTKKAAAGPVAAWMQDWFGISPAQASEQANTGPVAEIVRTYLKEHSPCSEDSKEASQANKSKS